MELGNFSVSLTVKDIHKSKAFYETLGFTQIHGDIEQNWIILKNGYAIIGLFQGMFEKNVLTFNPGWDPHGENIDPFTDIRTIQQSLKDADIPFDMEINPEAGDEGPASFMISDPDGNPVLIDQHR